MEPYLKEGNGYRYLPKDKVDETTDAIVSQYGTNVYTLVEDCGNGASKFLVGNLKAKVAKALYEIYIR